MTDRRTPRRFLKRRLPAILEAGAAIEIYEGEQLVFREVLDRAFRLESGGEEAALALWFRPVGYPEWEPRLGMDLYPIERARCLLVEDAVEDESALTLTGPSYTAKIRRRLDPDEMERITGWLRHRELAFSPDEGRVLDALWA